MNNSVWKQRIAGIALGNMLVLYDYILYGFPGHITNHTKPNTPYRNTIYRGCNCLQSWHDSIRQHCADYYFGFKENFSLYGVSIFIFHQYWTHRFDHHEGFHKT